MMKKAKNYILDQPGLVIVNINIIFLKVIQRECPLLMKINIKTYKNEYIYTYRFS